MSWKIDSSHTRAVFSVRHMMISNVHGQFHNVTGTVNFDEAQPTRSSVDVQIEAASIDTNDERRDGHLKSPDFLDAAKCPEITFKSTKVEKAGDEKYKVTGDLTIHCQTHPATFDATFASNPIKAPWGALVYVGNATTTVKRSEWGLTWNKPLDQAGGMLVGDDVKFEIDAEFMQKQEAPAAKKEAAAETKAKK